MREDLPQVIPWREPVSLYPEGPWLVDPQEYPDYVYKGELGPQAVELLAQKTEGCESRLISWTQTGVIESLQDVSYMESQSISEELVLESEPGELGGLEVGGSKAKGYRPSYQDRTAIYLLPMDSHGTWVYISALFDGHGPTLGGENVAKLLSEASGLQVLAESFYLWSQRLEQPWSKMSLIDFENGLHFACLQLQELIRKQLVDTLYQSHIAIEARSLAMTLQQTLMSMAARESEATEEIRKSIKDIENLKNKLDSFHSLEGVGSTAVYGIWICDSEKDHVDLWVANVGDSFAGILTKGDTHYCLVEEAKVGSASFEEDITARGGVIVLDDYGSSRLFGQYNLCRSFGDLFVLREWTEILGCVQIKGMSPRPRVTRVRFCENPTAPGEIAFGDLLGFCHHCDGIVETKDLSLQQIYSYIARQMEGGEESLESISRKVIEKAIINGSRDNCTLQIVDLRPLASASYRRKFYKSLKPSMIFQPSFIYHGFM